MRDESNEAGKRATDLARRRVLRFAGGTMAASLAPELCAQAGSDARGDVPACIVKPEQTEGPYFVDARLLRADIRSDPADGSMRAGVPLQLTLRLAAIGAGRCAPLAGALVDLWHNDAMGEYSDVRDRRYDTRGQRFLRGYQLTDASGAVTFTTIYPGWYPGRTVHIHFKVRIDPEARRGREFTSQLYFDDALTDVVHELEAYRANGARATRNDDDRIFRRGGSELLLDLHKQGEGFAATFALGVDLG